jgi:hypothetical protein
MDALHAEVTADLFFVLIREVSSENPEGPRL